ncbi:MAG: hypothetical protein WC623_22135 [Pedobacter sp.]|uniref:hypothetical protein n=1 Tax=Pedobacter sp. TaxID=1411316 RepID=UPI0035626C36
MTSPPYWGLRNYQTEPIIFDGEQGCEHEWVEFKKEWCDSSITGNSATVGNTLKDVQRFNYSHNTCSLCGAWRGQLGLEPTPELYLKHMLDLFDDVKLKLKDCGNVFVNLGTSYASEDIFIIETESYL